MDLVYYNGKHSVTFGDKNSWTDWHLIPMAKTVIPPPPVKTKQVDIPGMNGSINLTTVLTGYPLFSNRTGSISFLLAPGFESWESAKMEIAEYIHGQTMNLYLDDDPEYYYRGTFYIDSFKSDAKVNTLSISYDLAPFKYPLVASDEDWLWDTFNFETGVIREWDEITVNGSLTLTVNDCAEPTTAYISSNANMTLVHTYQAYDKSSRTKNYTITSGQNRSPGPILRPGTNTLAFTGTGKIGVSYRGGRL